MNMKSFHEMGLIDDKVELVERTRSEGGKKFKASGKILSKNAYFLFLIVLAGTPATTV